MGTLEDKAARLARRVKAAAPKPKKKATKKAKKEESK